MKNGKHDNTNLFILVTSFVYLQDPTCVLGVWTVPVQEDTSVSLAALTAAPVCAPWWRTPTVAVWSRRGIFLIWLHPLKVGGTSH